MENVLNEVELPFYDAFTKGGIESKEERMKSLLLGKDINTPSQKAPTKDDLDIDMDI